MSPGKTTGWWCAFRKAKLLKLAVFIFVLTGCAGYIPEVLQPPAKTEAVEGLGQANLVASNFVIKGKFGFQFRLEGLARLEAFDQIGRAVFVFIVRRDQEYLIVPSRKIYAQSSPGVLSRHFLGLDFSPEEAVCFFSGQFSRLKEILSDQAANNWLIQTDETGRVNRGEKSGFIFDIDDFFKNSPVPRSFRVFLAGQGRIKIISVKFNPAYREESFALNFLARYQRKTIEEMEQCLASEY